MTLKIKKLDVNFEKSDLGTNKWILWDTLRDKILGFNVPYVMILKAINVSEQTK